MLYPLEILCYIETRGYDSDNSSQSIKDICGHAGSTTDHKQYRYHPSTIRAHNFICPPPPQHRFVHSHRFYTATYTFVKDGCHNLVEYSCYLGPVGRAARHLYPLSLTWLKFSDQLVFLTQQGCLVAKIIKDVF